MGENNLEMKKSFKETRVSIKDGSKVDSCENNKSHKHGT